MFKKKINYSIFLLASLAIGLTACQKDKEDEPAQNTDTDEEVISNMADRAIQEDLDAITYRLAEGENSNNWQETLPECAEVTISGWEFPITVTIDYGNGCMDNYGNIRSGQIVFTMTDFLLNIGAVRTATLVDYHINNISVEGSRTTTNTGGNSEGLLTFTTISDMVLTQDEYTFTRNSSELITWLDGFQTFAHEDNVFSLEGVATIIKPDQTEVVRTITEALIFEYSCEYITQGVVEYSSPNGIWSIDFGDGVCDQYATVIWGQQSWQITL